MKTQIMIGVILAVVFIMNNKENDEASSGLIIEAVFEYYPNESFQKTDNTMKSENSPFGYEANELRAGNMMTPERGREKYIIKTDRF